MFGKVKKWLGIEGVKVDLELNDPFSVKTGLASGKILLSSMHEQTVTGIRVKMVEKYTRGRGKNKLTDEYEIGSIELERKFIVPAEEIIEVDFELPFELTYSEMDELQQNNILMGAVVGMAKKLQNVKSEFFIIAEANVSGTALHPFDRQLAIVS